MAARICAWFVACAGLIGLVAGLAMNTTVAGADGQRICNVGLMHDRSVAIGVSCLFVLLGALGEGVAVLRGAIADQATGLRGGPLRCPACREAVYAEAIVCPHCRTPLSAPSSDREARRQRAIVAEQVGEAAVEDWQRQSVTLDRGRAERAAAAGKTLRD